MRVFLRIAAVVSVWAGLSSAACLQSNLTTGTQADGSAFVLYMPETSCWNGNLVVFAHGYVAPQLPIGVPMDQLTVGGLSLPATLNQLGYAFAASSYNKNGLAITQGVKDTADLVHQLQPQLKPNRTYLIGASEGGLVTVLSAEKPAPLFNGAGAACGPIGDFQAQINYFGDFRVIFDYFFPGVLPGNAINIPQGLISGWTGYESIIEGALAANPSATAQLLNVLQAPVTSDPTTIAETVLGALWYNVFGTADAQATLGGQPYENFFKIYTGSANDRLLNSKVERYLASPAALFAVATQYQTSGRLKIPIVTIHTTGDPVIPYWHETLYTLKTVVAGTFFDRINIPVNAYGHCNFTGGEVLAAFDLIVLRDLGTELAALIEGVLPEPHLSEFKAALRRNQLQMAGR